VLDTQFIYSTCSSANNANQLHQMTKFLIRVFTLLCICACAHNFVRMLVFKVDSRAHAQHFHPRNGQISSCLATCYAFFTKLIKMQSLFFNLKLPKLLYVHHNRLICDRNLVFNIIFIEVDIAFINYSKFSSCYYHTFLYQNTFTSN
jgi:hypothetical protein